MYGFCVIFKRKNYNPLFLVISVKLFFLLRVHFFHLQLNTNTICTLSAACEQVLRHELTSILLKKQIVNYFYHL